MLNINKRQFILSHFNLYLTTKISSKNTQCTIFTEAGYIIFCDDLTINDNVRQYLRDNVLKILLLNFSKYLHDEHMNRSE